MIKIMTKIKIKINWYLICFYGYCTWYYCWQIFYEYYFWIFFFDYLVFYQIKMVANYQKIIQSIKIVQNQKIDKISQIDCDQNVEIM